MKEKLQEYALVAEIISAVAIVASLIFVGLEIRQGSYQTELNTKAIELTMADNYITQINSADQLLLNYPVLLELMSKRMSGESISQTDQIKISVYIRALFRVWQNSYYQYQNSSLDEQFLNQIKRQIRGLMKGNILIRDYWDSLGDDYDPEFKEFVNELLAEQ